MDLSPVRREILEFLLLHEKPVKAAQIAQETGKEQRAVQMHLIGLVKMDYADSPQKGQYAISENGKKALGLTAVSKEMALSILAPQPFDKAFHFYSSIGKPLNINAKTLAEFADKIEKVNAESINFHLNRGDFEAWFKHVGDAELSMKMELLKKRKVAGEEISREIREMVENRCMELATIAGQTSPSP